MSKPIKPVIKHLEINVKKAHKSYKFICRKIYPSLLVIPANTENNQMSSVTYCTIYTQTQKNDIYIYLILKILPVNNGERKL